MQIFLNWLFFFSVVKKSTIAKMQYPLWDILQFLLLLLSLLLYWKTHQNGVYCCSSIFSSSQEMLQLFNTTPSSNMTPAANVTIPAEDESGPNTLLIIIVLVMILLGFIGFCCWMYGPVAKAKITAWIRAQGNLENSNNDQHMPFLKARAVMVRFLTPFTEP